MDGVASAPSDDDDALVDFEADEQASAMDHDAPSSNPMAALLESARARATAYDAASPSASTDSEDAPLTTHPSDRAHAQLLPDLLTRADVLLYVLDARDPAGTRSRAAERAIAAHNAGAVRLILVLNKIDLVPPKALRAWLVRLRQTHPTLPLRASDPAPGARTYDHGRLTRGATAAALLKALKAYAARASPHRALTVAVAGFPNVGKSSVVNALAARQGRRSEPAPTGAEAGVTTAVRTVRLDSKLHLLDAPGVVFPSVDEDADAVMVPVAGGGGRKKGAEAQARLVLLSALPPKQIVDPVPAVGLLLKRVAGLPEAEEQVRAFYGLAPLVASGGDVTTDFLVQVARKRGRLGKGGVPNLDAAARTVLADWRDGRIGGWVEPPEEKGAVEDKVDGKQVVAEWGKEFAIEGLWGDTVGDENGEGDGDGEMEE